MKRSIIISIMCLSMLLPFAKTGSATTSKEKDHQIKTNLLKKGSTNTDNQEEVFSYLDVLGYYYDLVAKNVNEPTKTFDEFVTDFYDEDNDLNLLEFTYTFSNTNNVDSSELTSLINDGTDFFINDNNQPDRSSSSDADYILSADTYYYTPQSEFKRSPYVLLFNYSSLQTGDIIYETETIFFNAGHNAMIVDMAHSGYYGSYMQTIEAVGGGVQYGFLDDLRMAEYKIKILRVSGTTSTIRSNAIYFIRAQLGKPYYLNTFRLNTSIDSLEWYCSELVYAAYKYAGIDIGVKQGPNGLVYLSLGCLPVDIYNSMNTYEISMTFYGFLELSILGKSGTTWSIKIYNTCSFPITCYYNKKMCFESDAEHWTNLGNNVNHFSLGSHAGSPVSISENWFATHITASYVSNGYRIITYADGLNASTGSMNIYHNVISY